LPALVQATQAQRLLKRTALGKDSRVGSRRAR
jgi:hypothetical protein